MAYYVGRMAGRKGAEFIETALNGEYEASQKHHIDNGTVLISDIDALNDEKTTIGSYYMISNSLERLIENLLICAYQPTSEAAIERIDSGDFSSAGDFFAAAKDREKVALFIAEMSEEHKQDLDKRNRIGNGKYETNGATLSLKEALLSDNDVFKIIKDGGVILYDEIHSGFEALGVGFDAAGIFDGSYRPAIRINNVTEHTHSENTEGTPTEEASEALKWLEDSLKKGTISQADYAAIKADLLGSNTSPVDVADDDLYSEGM